MDEPVPNYPKCPVPRNGDAAKALKRRTLTNLYNARPQWLADARGSASVWNLSRSVLVEFSQVQEEEEE